MKSLKRFTKHTALAFAVLLSMYGCQKDDAVTLESKDSHQHNHSSTTKSVSASEIPRVMQFLESKSNERLEFVVDDTNSELGMHRSHEENLSMTTALVDQIKMVTNSYGRSNYTFKLIEEETRAGVYFLNLIVKEHKDEFYVFIMKYVPSEAWLNTFTDESSFGTYSGDIYFYDHDGVYAGKTTLVNGQTTSSDSREPCPPDIDHNSPTGGGNASATTGTASGVSSSTSSSTGTSGGSLEDLTANFGWLCNWWGELHQNPQECHNPAAGGSWTILADYGNEDRSMRDLTDCPRVSGECYQSNGDPCPNGCDENGYCIDEQEEIESSEIDINVDVAIARYNNFYGNLTSEQQGFLDIHPALELRIQQFLEMFGLESEELVIISIEGLMNYTTSDYPGNEEGLPYDWWNDEDFIENNFNFDLNEGIGDLTQAEKMLVAMYPAQALIIKANKEPAEIETQSRFGENGINNKSDAFRHAFFSAMNSNDAGDIVARLFSTAHESEVPQNLDLEKQMDLYNNDVGHIIGEDASVFVSDQELSNLVYQTLLNGNMVYLFPINYTDPHFWDNPNTIKPNDGDHGITNSTQLIPTDQ